MGAKITADYMKSLLLFVFSCLPLLSSPLSADPLPASAYGMLPAVGSVALSPSGNQLALLQNIDGRTVLGVNELAVNKVKMVLTTDNKKFKIRWFKWANDQILLVSADYPSSRYGIDSMETRLLKVDIRDPSKLKLFVEPRQWAARNEHMSQFQDQIVSLLPDDDEHVLMQMDLDEPTHPTVYRVELATGHKTRVRNPLAYVYSWIADQQGRVRLGLALDETRMFYMLFDPVKDEWRKIWEYELFDTPDIIPLGFGLDPDRLYVRAQHEDRYAVFRVDVASPELKRELIYADPDYDVEGSLVYSPRTHDVVGIWHGEAPNGYVYWSEDYRALQSSLDGHWPDADNAIVSANRDETLFIVYSSGARNPGAYYLVDLNAGSIVFIASEYPQLKEVVLAKKRKVQYAARDGKTIEAYLSIPADAAPDEPLPAVVLPHGGPMVRDYAGFDWLAEFIASRGYLVIQPNFRGSSGYGFEFEMQAIKKWGSAMQDDLEDAANYMIQQKLARADSICIVGASYSGYAALMAAATQQKTFRCAASFAGVTDLQALVADARYYVNADVVEKQIGTERKQLRQTSPLYLADRISIPVLVIHGENDRIVPVSHGRGMRDALKKYRKDYRYVEQKGGDHNLRVEAHRIEVLELLDGFLSENLKR